jgi:hypothetical protein
VVAAAGAAPAKPVVAAAATAPGVNAQYSCSFERDFSSLFAMCHVSSGTIQIVANCGHFELRSPWRGPGNWIENLDCSPFTLWNWRVEQTP